MCRGARHARACCRAAATPVCLAGGALPACAAREAGVRDAERREGRTRPPAPACAPTHHPGAGPERKVQRVGEASHRRSSLLCARAPCRAPRPARRSRHGGRAARRSMPARRAPRRSGDGVIPGRAPLSASRVARCAFQRSSAACDDASLLPAYAPGRVNIIGEHTDYNAGCLCPVAPAFLCRA